MDDDGRAAVDEAHAILNRVGLTAFGKWDRENRSMTVELGAADYSFVMELARQCVENLAGSDLLHVGLSMNAGQARAAQLLARVVSERDVSVEEMQHPAGMAGAGVSTVPDAPVRRGDADMPHVDGLGVTELGIFKLPEGAGAHAEFRIWLNNAQRLSFAIPRARRLYWLKKLCKALFEDDPGCL